MVLVEESSEAEVRFANNTTTTNGTRRDRRVTVISVLGSRRGHAVGVARRAGDVDVADLVRAAELDAAGSPPADDAARWSDRPRSPGLPEAAARFDAPPEETDLSVLGEVLGDLAGAFGRAEVDSDVVLAGFAEHAVTTVYLGHLDRSPAALTPSPTGALQLVARGPAAPLGVGRGRHRRLHRRVRRRAWRSDCGTDSDWASTRLSTSRPAATR